MFRGTRSQRFPSIRTFGMDFAARARCHSIRLRISGTLPMIARLARLLLTTTLILLGAAHVAFAAESTAEHPVRLRRRLGPLRQRLCEARRPGRNQRRGSERRTSIAWPREGVLFRRAFVSAPSLHALPQRAALGPALLAHRPRGDPARRGLGRLAACLPAAAPRRRLSHRRDVQGLEPRHAGRCALRRGEVRLREGRRPLQPVLRERHAAWSPTATPVETRQAERLYDEVRQNFDAFLADAKKDQPFCYWFGPTNVHRKWVKGSGKELWGIDPDALKGKLPPFLPDVPEVREDLADYLGEVQAFDAALGLLLGEARGDRRAGQHAHRRQRRPRRARVSRTASATCTTSASASRWRSAGAGTKGGRVVDDLVSLTDLAPTFLEAGGRDRARAR